MNSIHYVGHTHFRFHVGADRAAAAVRSGTRARQTRTHAARTHLLWVIHHTGPSTQVHLAEALEVTPHNITALVDGVTQSGFARRVPHPTDRRAVLVELTARGAEVMSTMAAEHTELGAALVAGLSEADQDRALYSLTYITQRVRELIAEEVGTRPNVEHRTAKDAYTDPSKRSA